MSVRCIKEIKYVCVQNHEIAFRKNEYDAKLNKLPVMLVDGKILLNKISYFSFLFVLTYMTFLFVSEKLWHRSISIEACIMNFSTDIHSNKNNSPT